MARTEKMITRTITTNNYTVFTANLEDMTVAKMTISIPEPVDEKRERLAIEKAVQTVNPKIAVMKYELTGTLEELYAISESDFLKYAHKVEKE